MKKLAGYVIVAMMVIAAVYFLTELGRPSVDRSVRKSHADELIQRLRSASQNPEEARKLRIVNPDVNGLIRLPLDEFGTTYVAVGNDDAVILVDLNGRTQIPDDDGDGTPNRFCWDCPTGMDGEQKQEVFDSGLASALEILRTS